MPYSASNAPKESAANKICETCGYHFERQDNGTYKCKCEPTLESINEVVPLK